MLGFDPNMDHKIKTDAGVDATRLFVAHVNYDSAAVQSIAAILAATAMTDAEQTIEADISDPDVARSLKLKANAAGVAGDVVINGKDAAGDEISETFALDGTTEVLGDKAFASVTSIVLPAETHAGTDTVSVGTANKLGLPYKLALNTVQATYRDGALETTAPTVAVSSTVLASNTVLLNSALNASDVDIVLLV